nr:MAG TPA: hypothetical protein [Bacteriophage sp.]
MGFHPKLSPHTRDSLRSLLHSVYISQVSLSDGINNKKLHFKY